MDQDHSFFERIIAGLGWRKIALFWSLVVIVSAAINILHANNQAENIARAQGLTIMTYLDLVRAWNIKHGGIFVSSKKSSEGMTAPEIDPSAMAWINPYVMTIQLSKLADESEHLNFRLTSLKPLNPANAADDWERNALQAFDQGEKVAQAFLHDEQQFRMMKPLYTQQECLECHGHQGHQVGDVRGAVSVTQDVTTLIEKRNREIVNILVVHLLIMLVIVLGLRLYARTQQRLQSLLIERQGAMQSNAFKSNFISSMSHELRTPLNAIIGLSETLEKDAAPAQRQSLRLIYQAGNQLENLVRHLFHFAKVDADNYQLEPEPIKLAELLAQVVNGARDKAEGKGLEISLQMPVDLPNWLMFDRTLLQTIIYQILDNAIKFTEQGSVTVEANAKRKGQGYAVLITVTDTGGGFDKDPASLAKHDFVQSEHYLDRRHGGLGLGLSLTRKMLQLVNGQMKISSTRGQGSIVRLYFVMAMGPAQSAADMTPAAPAESPVAAKPGEVEAEPADTTSSPAMSAADRDNALEVLAELRDLLAVGDASATAIVNEQAELLAGLGPKAEQLTAQIAGFDFGGALSTLDELEQQLSD